MGENDRLITILTDDLGIFRLAAPGARRPKSSLASASPLNYLSMQIFGKRSLKSIRQIKIIKSYTGLGKNIESIEVEPTIDILSYLGKNKTNQYLVGFALETEDYIENAKKKLNNKNLDAIILNSISDFSPISNNENKITFISSDSEIEYEKKSKNDVSKDIFEQIIKRCLKK